jgi:glycosyltransferase involved in cell wall biosynthesis
LASPLRHKRTDLILEYLSRWQPQTHYAGTVDWVGRLPEGLALPTFANWRHHPRLPEKEFRQLLHHSQVLVFSSEYEGFGMPPIEAILANVCPVYSDIPVTREVMAGAGCAFRNESYESFVHALQTGLKTPPAQVASWKQSLSNRFAWPRICDRLLEVLTTAR